jgi:hypothetical protein
MANIHSNRLFVQGAEAAVKAFEADGAGKAWTGDGATTARGVTEDGVVHWVEYAFGAPAKAPFDEVEQSTTSHPEVVATIATVELANLEAEARVLRGGETVGEYAMPADEVAEVAGEEADEGAVFNDLLNTVAAYEVEALVALEALKAAGKPATP